MSFECIDRISIIGYKSIRDLNLKMGPFTVLIGANGSGKSNFLDFFKMISYAFASTNGNLQLYIARAGKASSILHYGPRLTEFLDGSIRFIGDKYWSQYQFSLAWAAPDDLVFRSELIQYQRAHDRQMLFEDLGSGHGESKVLLVADRPRDHWSRQVARLFRTNFRQIRAYHFHDTSEDANVRTAQDLDSDDKLLNNAGNLAVILHNLKVNKPAHYRRILSTVQLIAPFIRDFVVDPQATNSRFVLLRWMDDSGETFGPHQLSDGTLRAIALITALLQPDETMPSIMIFDEPELGLHPSAIGLVASLLKAAADKRQVIVATQSPVLIRDYAPEDVIVVERTQHANGRGESTFTRLQSESLEAWLEDFDLGQLYEKNVTRGYPT